MAYLLTLRGNLFIIAVLMICSSPPATDSYALLSWLMGKRVIQAQGSFAETGRCPGRAALSRNATFHARSQPLALWTYFYICLE